MKTYLNDTFLNDAVDNQWENGEEWQRLITNQKWYNADQSTTPTASVEPTDSTTDNPYQIGLMYATVYMNAGAQDKTNWLFIKNGWTGNPTTKSEWTMSRKGFTSMWRMDSYGTLGDYTLTNPYAVRPVFYVSPNITLTGEGTTTEPFIIHS